MRSAVIDLFPHEALLVACAIPRTDAATRSRIDAALSAPGLDWEAALRTAVQQGVAALLALQMRGFPDDPRVPEPIRLLLERIYRAQAVRNQAMNAEAARLLLALDEAGICCLTLKGIGLALAVFPDEGLRCYADIDLLVAPEDVEQAGQVAMGLGFRSLEDGTTLNEYHRSYVTYLSEDILTDTLTPEFDRNHRPESLGTDIHRVAVEIHRSVFNLPGGYARQVDMVPFWERPTPVTMLDGTSIRIPAPEAMLTHLAAHAARHRYWRLIFVVDIVQAIHVWNRDIDWERLIAFAREYEAGEAVYRMLELARREFDADIPTEALQRLSLLSGADHRPLEMSDMFRAMDLYTQESSAVTLTWLLHERSVRQAALAAWRILFPAPSIMRRYYHVRSPLLIGGCYLIRPLQLMGRLLRVLYRMVGTALARRVRIASRNGRQSC